jgi:hypothetical protein
VTAPGFPGGPGSPPPSNREQPDIEERWRASAARLPHCGLPHGRDGGRLDESARRLDHPELAVARQLAAEGHAVRTVADRGRREPTPDLEVCGLPVEIKSLLSVAERGDHGAATARTVHNRLVSAARQAQVVVVATSGSGCTVAAAAAGVRSFAASGRTGRVAAVRVLGDGWDLSWTDRGVGAVTRPERDGSGMSAAGARAAARRTAPVAERGARSL